MKRMFSLEICYPVPKGRSPECQRSAPTFKVRTVITTFEVSPGTAHDLMDALQDAYRDFIRHQPGFLGAGLHMNDAQTRICNYSQWVRREDYQAALRSAEMRERNRRRRPVAQL